MILGTLVAILIPLYILIAMGFVGGRYMQVNLHSMAIVSIYFISPVVVFGAITKLDFTPSYLLLPVILYVVSVLVVMVSYNLAKLVFKDNMANLIGMSSATGNTGYFGLPIVLALFSPEAAGIYLLANFGMEINAITMGYYLGARGSNNVMDSFKKVLKLPVIHAVWLGLLWSYLDLPVPDVFDTYWTYFTGAWVVIGMMLIGVALGHIESFKINGKLLTYLSAVKFALWPMVMLGLIMLDRHVLGLYGAEVHHLMFILSITPLAANIVAFAAQLNVRPGEAAMTVILTTLFALFYIPLALFLYGL